MADKIERNHERTQALEQQISGVDNKNQRSEFALL
jgi:hypothetical protein